MKNIIFFVLFALSLTSCKSRSDSNTRALKDFSDHGEIFYGCAPSAGECANSCPSMNGRGVENDPQCVNNPECANSAVGCNWGCYCPAGSQQRPIDTTRYQFMECYREGGYCEMLCKGRESISQRDESVCGNLSDYACYCEKDMNL